MPEGPRRHRPVAVVVPLYDSHTLSRQPAQYEPRVPPHVGVGIVVGLCGLVYAALTLLGLWVAP